jgi:FkbM family methyltransferase
MNNYRKIFIDCGAHQLGGISSFINQGVVSKDFEVYMFEPNSACDTLNRVKNSKVLQNILVNFHEKAVWDEDVVLNFNQEHFKTSRSGSPSDGQSDRDGWGSSIAGEMQHDGYLTQIKVQAFDFSNFLSKFNGNDMIICKMDIEGSEYRVLRRLISTGEIKKINSLYVEFHAHFKNTESAESTKSLISEIISSGVQLFIGDALASWRPVTAWDDVSKLQIKDS